VGTLALMMSLPSGLAYAGRSAIGAVATASTDRWPYKPAQRCGRAGQNHHTLGSPIDGRRGGRHSGASEADRRAGHAAVSGAITVPGGKVAFLPRPQTTRKAGGGCHGAVVFHLQAARLLAEHRPIDVVDRQTTLM
jgi:hypothetical protein